MSGETLPGPGMCGVGTVMGSSLSPSLYRGREGQPRGHQLGQAADLLW